jgi:hypothetical protein
MDLLPWHEVVRSVAPVPRLVMRLLVNFELFAVVHMLIVFIPRRQLR